MITKEVKNKVYEEMGVYFERHIELSSGIELEKRDNGYFEGEREVPHESVISFKFNQKTRNAIVKNIPIVLRMRGVKDADGITENDNDVKRLIKQWQKSNGGKKVSPVEVNAFIESVSRMHAPHSGKAILEVIIWAMIRESVFKLEPNGYGFECKFDINIPENYWENGGVANDDLEDVDEFDKLLDNMISHKNPTKPMYDGKNPLEQMLAITAIIVNDYNDQLSDIIADATQRVNINITTFNDKFDDVGMFRTKLREHLSQELF